MTPDHINGALEFIGSLMLWANVWRLFRDKQTHGVTWYATGFFMTWGFWNLYYYPHLEQRWSFYGGVSLVLANTVWLLQMLYYRRRNDAQRPTSQYNSLVASADSHATKSDPRRSDSTPAVGGDTSNPHRLSQFGWSDKQKRCEHKELECSTDSSCGGWFETCKECRALVNGAMMGHN